MRGIVWGYTFRDGVNKLKEIEENYNRIGIKSDNKRKTKNNYSIIFSNGDNWQVARYSESSRGLKANISYVDIRIDLEFVNTIIKYSTYLPPYNAIRYFEALQDC